MVLLWSSQYVGKNSFDIFVKRFCVGTARIPLGTLVLYIRWGRAVGYSTFFGMYSPIVKPQELAGRNEYFFSNPGIY